MQSSMDSPYSPLHSHAVPRSMSPPSHSPPLVPVPHGHHHPHDAAAPYDPHYQHQHHHHHASSHHRYPYDPYRDDHSHSGYYSARRDYPPPPPAGGHPDWAYAPPPSTSSRDYHDYYRGPPRGDPYAYPPPPPRDPYYSAHPSHVPHHPHHPHDPYYPPYPPQPSSRDPYAYPSSAPSWPAPHPPSAGASASSLPPPAAPAAPAAAVPPPSSSTAVSLGPHPEFGELDPADLSIPILYLARPVSNKTFVPLKKRHLEHLDLRFINSLLELSADLHRASVEDAARAAAAAQAAASAADAADDDGEGASPSASSERPTVVPAKPIKRRIWITAVGGTDALVQRVRANTHDKLDWREIADFAHLERELAFEDKQVALARERVRREADEEEERRRAAERGDDVGEPSGGDHEREEAMMAVDDAEREQGEDERRERERGQREIEERDQRRPSDARDEADLDQVLRDVRGEGENGHGYRDEPERNPTRGQPPVEGYRPVPERGTYGYDDDERARAEYHYRQHEAAYRPVAHVGDMSRIGERDGPRGEAVVDRLESIAWQDEGRSEVGGERMYGEHAHPQTDGDGHHESRARKRSRHETEDEQDHVAARAARKKLEAICKAPRRSCVDWAEQNGVAVDDETRMADDEPVLGERHRGVWDLFGHELDEVSPQIQVLMARALRDVTYSPRLRLYENDEATKVLEETVPWFLTLLNTIKDRYELAGAASVVPQDPPISEPFEENPVDARLAESETAVAESRAPEEAARAEPEATADASHQA
ncbi:hypothetical protein JCM10212_000016 [Sporobolomyces blumeae]